MKKFLSSLLLMIVAITVNAQTILMGDTNGDNQLSIADVTSTVNMVLGKSPALTYDLAGMAYRVDNQSVVGRWKAPDNSTLRFNADGTTDYPGGATYKFRPFQGTLTIYDALSNAVRTLVLLEVESDHLLIVDYATQTHTLYTNDSRVTGIVLNHSSLNLNSGATTQLIATITPSDALNPNLQWSSSDESVATVSQVGFVTAVAGGSCTITCAATDGSGVTATCEVTVTQLVTSITLSHSTLTLPVDGFQRLTATVLPENAVNKTVTWSSSDEDVAEVTRTGGVSAVSPGTCTITCAATDGSGVTATCSVIVANLVTDITITPNELSLDVGETSTLTTTILPTNATITAVTWSSSNESVATVDANGQVTTVAVGTCTITCAATDGSRVTATCAVTVNEAHEYVDLGLPSGTLWATCNIGASSPSYNGDYFAWGETTGYANGKTTFSWGTYKYCNGSGTTMTKYCTSSDYGTVDNKTELDLSDDAAYVNWGPNWRIPSISQLTELINDSYTTQTWTNYGYKITSKSNGNSIFLPAAGYRSSISVYLNREYGYYWSRNLIDSRASCLTISSVTPTTSYWTGNNDEFYYNWFRYVGRSIRPVRVSQ